MLEAKYCFDQMIWWEPRSGTSTVWFDNWTQLGALQYVLPISQGMNQNFEEVSQLKKEGKWDKNLLHQLFCQDVTEHIENTISCEKEREGWDKPWWMLTTTGKLTVRSAWEEIKRKKEVHEDFSNMWIKRLPFKIAFFLWRLMKQRLPIGEVLDKIGVTENSQCFCCTIKQQESILHVFLYSDMTK